MRIGIVGGTGREGRGLALRWAAAGHEVAVGSRDADRARARAEELRAVHAAGGAGGGAGKIEGGSNEEAVSAAQVVVLAVPYAAHEETLRALAPHLAGRVVIDITVPLQPPKVHQVHLPRGEAAAMEAQAILGPGTPVVAALHHVSSAHLGDPSHPVECDVLVCSDDAKAMETTLGLIHELGLRGLDAGPLRNAIALESLTPVLLHLGKRYKSPGVGVRFTGIK
jgi:8-hydroxy-5-deazaflavin:NADPH oxidoreductase